MFQLIWESSKRLHLLKVPQPCGPRLEGDTHNHTQTTVSVIAPNLFSVVRGTTKNLEVTKLRAEFRIKSRIILFLRTRAGRRRKSKQWRDQYV